MKIMLRLRRYLKNTEVKCTYLSPLPIKMIDELRDVIGISFVRLAQHGNLLARQELMGLIKYTIDDWIERYYFLSRWRGYEDEIQKQLEACIRRYRYTGSFVNYVFRTLECAGRGIRPARVYSLDHSESEWVTHGDQGR